MKVFLTGGSGYIGSAVALALHTSFHAFLSLFRSASPAPPRSRHRTKSRLRCAQHSPRRDKASRS